VDTSLLPALINQYYPKTAEKVGVLIASNVLLEKLSESIYKKANDAVQQYATMVERILTVRRMLLARGRGDYNDIKSSSVFIAGAILFYFVNPIDLLPDFIPFIGGLDDLLLLSYLLKITDKEIERYLAWEQQQR